MNDKLDVIKEVTNNDILFVYKEKTFSGFAPCFDNDLFHSLVVKEINLEKV